MTPLTEDLSRRTRKYTLLAVAAAVIALMGGALIHDFWVGSPARNTSFAFIDVPWQVRSLWEERTAVPTSEQDRSGLIALGGLGLLATAVALVVFRQSRWLLLLVVVSALWLESENAVRRHGGYYRAEATQLSSAGLSGLQQSASALAAAHAKTSEPLKPAPVIGPARFTTPPEALPNFLNYTLAQYFYLKGDAAATRRHIDAIYESTEPFSHTATWRIAVMETWLAAATKAPKPADSPLGIGFLTLDGHRFLGWLGAVMAMTGTTIAALLTVLAAIMTRRIHRITQLTAQGATPPGVRSLP